jgi:hypothetical protein
LASTTNTWMFELELNTALHAGGQYFVIEGVPLWVHQTWTRSSLKSSNPHDEIKLLKLGDSNGQISFDISGSSAIIAANR